MKIVCDPQMVCDPQQVISVNLNVRGVQGPRLPDISLIMMGWSKRAMSGQGSSEHV